MGRLKCKVLKTSIFYCKDAVDKIESIQINKLNQDIDLYKMQYEKSRSYNKWLKNRNIIQRILNK